MIGFCRSISSQTDSHINCLQYIQKDQCQSLRFLWLAIYAVQVPRPVGSKTRGGRLNLRHLVARVWQQDRSLPFGSLPVIERSGTLREKKVCS